MPFLEDDFPEGISIAHRWVGDYYQTYDLFFARIPVFPFLPALPIIGGIVFPRNANNLYLQRIRPLHYNIEFDYLVAFRNYMLTLKDKRVMGDGTFPYKPVPLETYKIPDIGWDQRVTVDRDTAIHYVVNHHDDFWGWHRQELTEGVNKLAYPILNNTLIAEDPEASIIASNPAVDRYLYTSNFNLPTFSFVWENIPIPEGPLQLVTRSESTSELVAFPVPTGQSVGYNIYCRSRGGNCERLVTNFTQTGPTTTTLVDTKQEIPSFPRRSFADICILRGTNNKYGQELLEDVGSRPIFYTTNKLLTNLKPDKVTFTFDPLFIDFFRFEQRTVFNFDDTGSSYDAAPVATFLQCSLVVSGGFNNNCRGWTTLDIPYDPFISVVNIQTLTVDYTWNPIPRTPQTALLVLQDYRETEHDITKLQALDSYWLLLNEDDPLCLENVEMPDSPRLMEIHAALRADLYGQTTTDEESGNSVPRKTNLAWHIASLCKMFGINYDKDGKNQMVQIRADGISERRPIQVVSGTTDDPASLVRSREGTYPFGCVGFTNENLETGELSGVNPDSVNSYPQWVYKVKSNQFVETEFGSTEIQSGDYVICYTIQQFLQTIMQDLDKALGMANAGANAIPNADGSEKICTYEGLGTLVAENAYMLSSISRQTSQGLVSSLIAQAVGLELLKATGYPLQFKEIKSKVGGLSDVSIPYPALADNSPSVNSQVLDILNNIGPLVANLLCPVEPEEGSNL